MCDGRVVRRVIGAVIYGIIWYLQDLILVQMLGLEQPAIVASLVLPALAALLILGIAAVGFAAGSGHVPQ